MRYIVEFIIGTEWFEHHRCASATQAWAAAMDMRMNHGHAVRVLKQRVR